MIAKRHETVLLILTALGGVIIMKNEKEYVYDIEEYSQDVRHYQITSNVKLTYDEVRNSYQESDAYNRVKVFRGFKNSCNNLSKLIDWSNDRFTNHQIDKQIKVYGVFQGTKYGDDCQVDITGEFEND
tara:strand:+ start:2364 stop:2747 length:384 start_codon:yes stop_codon:yes gene_type:complete